MLRILTIKWWPINQISAGGAERNPTWAVHPFDGSLRAVSRVLFQCESLFFAVIECTLEIIGGLLKVWDANFGVLPNANSLHALRSLVFWQLKRELD